MFKRLAEDITFLLIKNKIVDIEEYDVYVYGFEVLLLNVSDIAAALMISVMTKTLLHFAVFALIFVPLRTFAGGYHAKTSEICFAATTFMYALTVFIVRLFEKLYENIAVIGLTFILAVVIILFAPFEHENNPLDENIRVRNRIISIVLTATDSVIFIILKKFSIPAATSVMIFIAVQSFSMILGIIVKNRSNKKERN